MRDLRPTHCQVPTLHFLDPGSECLLKGVPWAPGLPHQSPRALLLAIEPRKPSCSRILSQDLSPGLARWSRPASVSRSHFSGNFHGWLAAAPSSPSPFFFKRVVKSPRNALLLTGASRGCVSAAPLVRNPLRLPFFKKVRTVHSSRTAGLFLNSKYHNFM